jgi:hypothetical protein
MLIGLDDHFPLCRRRDRSGTSDWQAANALTVSRLVAMYSTFASM